MKAFTTNELEILVRRYLHYHNGKVPSEEQMQRDMETISQQLLAAELTVAMIRTDNLEIGIGVEDGVVMGGQKKGRVTK